MIAQATGQRTLTIGEHTATVATWQRAIERARAEGVKVWRVGGEWITSSVSRPGKRHHVNGHCDCEGAQRGLICKHLAAVVAARYRAGELVRCEHCGRVGEASQMHHELRWLGGQGWVDAWYCAGGHLPSRRAA